MGKRLFLGLVKGLALGVALGAIVHFALGWRVTPGLSGSLLAMGTGATAGILAGRPPWRREAWLEGVLKALVGVGLGLGLLWLVRRFLAAPLPFGLLGAPKGSVWTDLPLLYVPTIAIIYGAVVEMDNSPGKSSGSGTDPHAPTVPADDVPSWDA